MKWHDNVFIDYVLIFLLIHNNNSTWCSDVISTWSLKISSSKALYLFLSSSNSFNIVSFSSFMEAIFSLHFSSSSFKSLFCWVRGCRELSSLLPKDLVVSELSKELPSSIISNELSDVCELLKELLFVLSFVAVVKIHMNKHKISVRITCDIQRWTITQSMRLWDGRRKWLHNSYIIEVSCHVGFSATCTNRLTPLIQSLVVKRAPSYAILTCIKPLAYELEGFYHDWRLSRR